MVNAIQLNGKTYPSKEQLKREVREFLSKNLGKTFATSSEEFVFLDSLCSRHPNREENRLDEVNRFRIGRDFSDRGYEVTYYRIDGSSDKLSWIKCCMARDKTDRVKYTEGKRREVWQQVYAYRIARAGSTQCYSCGVVTNYLEVDHIIPFVTLLKDWEESRLGVSWPAFHLQHAKYQLLCKPCHILKTSTK